MKNIEHTNRHRGRLQYSHRTWSSIGKANKQIWLLREGRGDTGVCL